MDRYEMAKWLHLESYYADSLTIDYPNGMQQEAITPNIYAVSGWELYVDGRPAMDVLAEQFPESDPEDRVWASVLVGLVVAGQSFPQYLHA